MKSILLIKRTMVCIIMMAINTFLGNCFGQIKSKPVQYKPSSLKVFYPRGTIQDTLLLYYSSDINGHLTNPGQHNGGKLKATLNADGSYHFNFPGSPMGYTQIHFLFRMKRDTERDELNHKGVDYAEKLLINYVISNGDQLVLNVKLKPNFDPRSGYRHNFSLAFSGKGAVMQNLWHSVDSIDYQEKFTDFIDSGHNYILANTNNEVVRKTSAFLKAHKSELNEQDYYMVLAHAVFASKSIEARLIAYDSRKKMKDFTDLERRTFKRSFDSVFNGLTTLFPTKILKQSLDYAEAEYFHRSVQAALSGPGYYKDSVFNVIRSNGAGWLRDRLLVQYFNILGSSHPGAINHVEEAIGLVNNPKFKGYLRSFSYAPGSVAANFELIDLSGKMVKLSDFKGKVVMLDFWYTGCLNCVEYYTNSLSKAEEHFKNDTSVVFITINIDRSKAIWQNTVRSGKYTSEKIINLYTGGSGHDHDVIKAYGVHDYPRPVLISKDQKIVCSDDSLRMEQNIIRGISLEKER